MEQQQVTDLLVKPPKPGPVHSETGADGSRWYIHPRTGERFMSVTTVLGNIAKHGLPDWSAKLSAEAAFDRLPWLNRCSRVDPCNASGEDACGNCRACAVAWLANRHNVVRDAAGDRGTKLHDAAEQDTVFGAGAEVDDDVRPFVKQFRRWRDRYQPEFLAAEMTVISRKWGYAGTLDTILRFNAASKLDKKLAHLVDLPLCVDYKTSKSVDIVKGWQVVAYSAADSVLLPDGSEEPMPEIKGGLILHLQPPDPKDQAEQGAEAQVKVQMREVYLTDANHARFVHALRVAEGLGAGLNSVLSRPVTFKEA
jgi:hypothetical protein